ncbi:MAG: L-ribulose-5-phosphate 3-epimerase [Verrucomicrobiales bacterium]|jgi:L-ribulose-5-phosphate 3-epimerase
MKKLNRRRFLLGSAAAGILAPFMNSAGQIAKPRISACDWSIGMKQTPEALKLAQQIGLDGVEVSFSDGGEFDLRKREVRKTYYETSRKTGVVIASLAMGVLNQRPFATDPDSPKWVADCIETMATMKAEAFEMSDDKLASRVAPSVVLLAFFGKGDINGKPELMKATIERLKRLAPQAEKAGVVLGLETRLNADDHLEILTAVDSPSVKVYYDTRNMADMGYPLLEDIRKIGGENLCGSLHFKEKQVTLGKGDIDFVAFKNELDKLKFEGWLTIESSLPKDAEVLDAYRENAAYLRSLFSA